MVAGTHRRESLFVGLMTRKSTRLSTRKPGPQVAMFLAKREGTKSFVYTCNTKENYFAQRHGTTVPITAGTGSGYGDDFTTWSERFKLIVKVNNYDEAKGIKLLPLYLDPTTYSIYRELEQAGTPTTLDQAISVLNKALRPRTATTWLSFTHQKMHPKEHPMDFATRLRHMTSELMPGLQPKERDELCTHQFLAGIPPDYARVLCNEISTLSLFDAALRVQQLLGLDEARLRADSTPNAAELLGMPSTDNMLVDKELASLSDPPVSSVNLVPPTSCPPSIICHRCGRPGHFAKDCRMDKSIGCRKCGRRGHVSRACHSQVKSGNGQGKTH
ncbi:hypothetical protein Pmar_PMAR027223 [Perkinsus marinus ATCC 50983]|uniref:CCHC-type domain-containing protein n=1 Tax=Perkinsus marinus (strain ATCC 50983 / TXsc) TaxID=423536 RepID=C5LWW1_PERM5|nr:hypothetical protein Pmar_PMAR027223 [Perkinsus marinus ATCC 50983]EEQ98739.1 hypothetical protein Pmar_PMAR027223 [Perkinsus marinus ATCC 50983]|eukprot:XP_002766022.1 hypothetical protein Pmar_PMAR027223 [Perkinsus marinus ATCC 50983]